MKKLMSIILLLLCVNVYSQQPYSNTRLKQVNSCGSLKTSLTGTVSVTAGTSTVVGIGTDFTNEINSNDAIKLSDEVFSVLSVSSNTILTLDANHTAGASTIVAFSDGDLFIIKNGDNANQVIVNKSGSIFMNKIKSGATQVGAGAVVNELWRTSGHATLPDGVIMIGL